MSEDVTTPGRLVISVTGRPAPQGSKQRGAAGQLLEQSPYLASWRAAVKRDTYRAYRAAGIAPDVLPLLRGPVGIAVTFRLDTGQRIDSPPDIDKLLRATFDALSAARAWEDDGRVVQIERTSKRQTVTDEPTGADIEIWSVTT